MPVSSLPHQPVQLDYRDHVIQHLADDEYRLRERLASVEADLDSYHLLTHELLHALHTLTRKHDRLTDAYHRLRGQLRTEAAA